MVMHITEKPEARLKNAVIISFIVSVILLGVKFGAYVLTGSAAILSDATESIVNVIAAAFAYYSLKVAMKPPDEDHPYGHGKAEFFSAAFEGGAIIVAALWIIYKAVHELVIGPEFHKLDVGIWLINFSIVVNFLLGIYLVKKGQKEKALILEADGKHLLTDVLTSVGVVVGLVIMYFTGWLWLDGVIAILMAALIIRTGVGLLRVAAGGMMDVRCKDDDAAIRSILDEQEFREVCGYHKLRHRHSGGMHFVDFHLIFPRETTVSQAHAVATAIEAKVAEALGDAGVMAHIEPCKRKDCPHCKDRIPKS